MEPQESHSPAQPETGMEKQPAQTNGSALDRRPTGNADGSSDGEGTAVGAPPTRVTTQAGPGPGRRLTRTVSLGRAGTRDRPEKWMPKPDRYSPRDDVTLAVDWSAKKKWFVLLNLCAFQIIQNLNTSIYGNAIDGIVARFGVSEQVARIPQCTYLVLYALGSMLWAPVSEEGLGRRSSLQLSMFLVNVFQIPAALAQNFGTMVVARSFGGLFSAAGSVTLGVVADLWEGDDQGAGVIVIVFASVAGASLGPIFGGLIQQGFSSWRAIFWFQLIFGGVVQLVHLFLVPETRSVILLHRAAKQRRKEGKMDEADQIESLEDQPKITLRYAWTLWYRPFEMFVREPIVLCLSLLSGFSDALIFTFLEAYQILYKQYNFTPNQLGAAYVPIVVGYILVAISYIYPLRLHNRIRRENPNKLTPEARLWWLLFFAPLLPIGLFGTGFTSYGPPKVPWIAPMLFSALIGIANYAIYMSTIDYMIYAYGPYSSSATAGNALARDGIAGAASLYATPMFEAMGLRWGTAFLGFVGILVIIPVYLFYRYGPQIRYRSKFAMSLAEERAQEGEGEQAEAARAMKGEDKKGGGEKEEKIENTV